MILFRTWFLWLGKGYLAISDPHDLEKEITNGRFAMILGYEPTVLYVWVLGSIRWEHSPKISKDFLKLGSYTIGCHVIVADATTYLQLLTNANTLRTRDHQNKIKKKRILNLMAKHYCFVFQKKREKMFKKYFVAHLLKGKWSVQRKERKYILCTK